MLIEVVALTSGHTDNLSRLMDSIEASEYQNYEITILCGMGDGETARLFGDDWRVANILESDVATGCAARLNTALALSQADVALCLPDDVELSPHCLKEARRLFDEFGLDSMVAWKGAVLRQSSRPSLVAMGAAFMDRFPGRQCFCPDYHTMEGAKEVIDLALALGRCHEAPRGAIVPQEADFILRGRKHKAWTSGMALEDQRTRRLRRRSGLLWGRDAALLHQSEKEGANERAGLSL